MLLLTNDFIVVAKWRLERPANWQVASVAVLRVRLCVCVPKQNLSILEIKVLIRHLQKRSKLERLVSRGLVALI